MDTTLFKEWLHVIKGLEENEVKAKIDALLSLNNTYDLEKEFKKNRLANLRKQYQSDVLELYYSFKRNKVMEQLSLLSDIDFSLYDGSYTLFRTALSSISSSRYTVDDFNLLIALIMNSGFVDTSVKKDKVLASTIRDEDKTKLVQLLEEVHFQTKKGRYQRSNESYGMLYDEVVVEDEVALRIVELLLYMNRTSSEVDIFNYVNKEVQIGYPSLPLTTLSLLLHYTREDSFYVVDAFTERFKLLLEMEGVILEPFTDLTYTDNVLRIKQYRDTRTIFRNYIVIHEYFRKVFK